MVDSYVRCIGWQTANAVDTPPSAEVLTLSH